jgi:Flp pilus assembly protein TadG
MMEFAVTFPFLLILAISIADYGYYLEHVNNITTVVRDGTRYASNDAGTLPWTSYCSQPAWSGGSTGYYTCPAATYTVSTTEQLNHGTNYTTITNVSAVPVAFPNDTAIMIGTSPGTEVNLAATANAGATSLTIESWNPPTSLTGTTQITWSPPSNNVQSLIQDEAESLTVPEGGLALDNVDCSWSTGNPAWGATPSIPSSFPAGDGGSGTPSSCISIVYYSSPGGTYNPSGFTVAGWWTSDSDCFDTGSTCLAPPAAPSSLAGDVVQVTVLYAWSSTNPGPVFDVLNSTFGLKVDITAQYALVVEA